MGAFSQSETIAYLTKNQHEIGILVLGWPFNMDGTEGKSVNMVKSFEGQLKKALPTIPIYHWDERLSSFSAEQRLIETGRGKKMRKDKSMVDAMAATIILEEFLKTL